MALILDGTDGITQPTITTAFGLPAGTTAQRPSVSEVGMIRFNTDINALENFTADGWFRVDIPIPTLTAVAGNIFAGAASTLTLTGTDFGVGAGTVRFTSGETVANVAVTPASPTSATVTVPSAIFNLSTSTVVDIQFINEDNGVSNSINKTVVALPSGGTITTAGGFRIHTFTSSGTFATGGFAGNVQYLVVAGGAAGGNDQGGGGGAGGYRCSVPNESSGGGAAAESPLVVTSSTNFTVTVGAGGASVSGSRATGTNGANSVFGSITATGGGGGGGLLKVGASGGSGGGGGGNDTVSSQHNGGSGTSGQGFAGGTTPTSSRFSGSGGGGADQAGVNAGFLVGGNGGNGVASSITGTSVTRAGGGGGGVAGTASRGLGGTGGGGNGGTDGNAIPPTAGTVNTGGGGGGAHTFATGAGGSGIVIVRFAF